MVQKKENESGSPPKNDDGTATDQGLAAGDVRSLSNCWQCQNVNDAQL